MPIPYIAYPAEKESESSDSNASLSSDEDVARDLTLENSMQRLMHQYEHQNHILQGQHLELMELQRQMPPLINYEFEGVVRGVVRCESFEEEQTRANAAELYLKVETVRKVLKRLPFLEVGL